MSEIKNPLVSVVVPVHNSGKYLRDALDSLVYQTLENIEIIIVENGSTDDTIEIAKEYVQRFPEKVFFHSIPPVTTSAEGRTLGHKLARAEYIYSCDGDDLVDFRALKLLYEKAVEGDYDIVGGRNYTYVNGKRTCTAKLPEDLSVSEYIRGQNPSFWSKLVKKSLIQKMGDIPVNIPLSDVAYVLPLSSYAKKVAYVNWPPVYHYFRREGSEVNTAFTKVPLDIISPERIALEKSNPEYRAEMLYHIAIRITNNLQNRWPLTDVVVPWLKELWPELKENHYLTENEKLFEHLSAYAALPDEPMPCVIYVNGFNQDHEAKAAFSNAKNTPFWNLERIEELNEENCDVNEHPVIAKAYEAGNYEFVAQYFAIKRIYETGGVYLHKNIVIDAPLNYTRYWRSFFGFVDDKTYSDWVFGGHKGSEVFAALLQSYNYAYDNDEFYPLPKRISTVLLAEFGMHSDGRTNLENMQICCTFGPEVVFCRDQGIEGIQLSPHLCHHERYHYPPDVETYTLSADTLRTIINNNMDSLSQSYSELKDELKSLKDVDKELRRIENSSSWKLVQIIKKIGNSPVGMPVKSLVKKFLK